MARLRRMEGQVRGVQRMVEEDQYCLDVLTQLSAIIAAARQTGLLVLEDHVRGCVLGAEHCAGRDRPRGTAHRADRRHRSLRAQRRLTRAASARHRRCRPTCFRSSAGSPGSTSSCWAGSCSSSSRSATWPGTPSPSLPEPGVIKWAWVLTTLYLGPIGAAFYILADKEPRPGEHERYVAPMWKQALGSTLHCVSGDAAGVIIAATVTGLLGLPMWFDMTAEYVLGFAFGLFIFQALFMKDMMGGSYRRRSRRPSFPSGCR